MRFIGRHIGPDVGPLHSFSLSAVRCSSIFSKGQDHYGEGGGAKNQVKVEKVMVSLSMP
jgi:hypothetical protein